MADTTPYSVESGRSISGFFTTKFYVDGFSVIVNRVECLRRALMPGQISQVANRRTTLGRDIDVV